MSISETSIFIPSPSCIARLNKKTKFVEILNIGPQMQTYEIDGAFAFTWKQIDGKRTIKQILQRMLNEFEVTRPKAKKDLLEFVEQLLDLELIQER
jgi:hypothetical protein